MKLAPRKESEFVEELKLWFMAASPTNSFVHKTFSITGEPDLYFATRKKDGSLGEFRAEAKYVDREPTSLKAVYKMLRGSQQVTIPRMAVASRIPIYLITCIAGKECLWHLFESGQCLKVIQGKIPPWEALLLRHVGVRSPLGKWELADPDDNRAA